MSANRKEIYRRGCTYVITRRIVQRKASTVLRVRVVAYKGVDISKHAEPLWNQFRDYTSIAEGDSVFSRHVSKIASAG